MTTKTKNNKTLDLLTKSLNYICQYNNIDATALSAQDHRDILAAALKIARAEWTTAHPSAEDNSHIDLWYIAELSEAERGEIMLAALDLTNFLPDPANPMPSIAA